MASELIWQSCLGWEAGSAGRYFLCCNKCQSTTDKNPKGKSYGLTRVARPMNSIKGVSTHTRGVCQRLTRVGWFVQIQPPAEGAGVERDYSATKEKKQKKKISVVYKTLLFCGLAVQPPVCPGISQL